MIEKVVTPRIDSVLQLIWAFLKLDHETFYLVSNRYGPLERVKLSFSLFVVACLIKPVLYYLFISRDGISIIQERETATYVILHTIPLSVFIFLFCTRIDRNMLIPILNVTSVMYILCLTYYGLSSVVAIASSPAYNDDVDLIHSHLGEHTALYQSTCKILSDSAGALVAARDFGFRMADHASVTATEVAGYFNQYKYYMNEAKNDQDAASAAYPAVMLAFRTIQFIALLLSLGRLIVLFKMIRKFVSPSFSFIKLLILFVVSFMCFGLTAAIASDLLKYDPKTREGNIQLTQKLHADFLRRQSFCGALDSHGLW